MKYECPICKIELTQFNGEKMHPGDPSYGITLSCQNEKCPCQEVMGHGKNVAGAYEVIKTKYKT